MKLGNPSEEALKPLLCTSLPSTHFIPPRLTLIVKVGVNTWLRPTPIFQRLLGFRCPGPAGSPAPKKAASSSLYSFLYEYRP